MTQPLSDLERAIALADQGRDLLKTGDFSTAYDLLRESIAMAPNGVALEPLLALILRVQGVDEVRRTCLELDPVNHSSRHTS